MSEHSETTIFDNNPTFLIIDRRRHWVDKVLRSGSAGSLDLFLVTAGYTTRHILGKRDAQVITETDQNYTSEGEITIAKDSEGRAIQAFSFKAYGSNPYLTFFYSSPQLLRR